MPRETDTDLNKALDANITVTGNVECADCGALFDVSWDTGAKDEDGLTDVEPGDLVTTVRCPNCGTEDEHEYQGWMNYGDAG